MAAPATLPILYSFRRCPYAIRARLAILAGAQCVELREVKLSCKPEAMLLASPKGTVPVLVLPKGPVLEQSLDIMLWALRAHDPQGWLPATAAGMSHALDWIARCDTDFKPALDRYKYPNRYGLHQGSDHRNQGALFLQALDTQLQENASLNPGGMGLADAAIAPFVRQFAHTDSAWFAAQPWPALQQWLHTFEASAAFVQAMHSYPAWKDGAPATPFPACMPGCP